MIRDWKLLSIYACNLLARKKIEANTLAMLFEAHRSLLIDFFSTVQKLPKMLIMAQMCTSLSIMRQTPKCY